SAARTGRFTPWENPSTLPIRSAFAWFAYFAVPSAFSRLILARLRLTEFPRAWNLPSEGLRRGQPSRVGRPLAVCSGAASGEATENSPRFQPWECGQTIHKPRRPEGRKSLRWFAECFRSSLRDSVPFGGRQPSDETLGYCRLSPWDARWGAVGPEPI